MMTNATVVLDPTVLVLEVAALAAVVVGPEVPVVLVVTVVVGSGAFEMMMRTCGAAPGTTPAACSCWLTTGPPTTVPFTETANPPMAGVLSTVTETPQSVVEVNPGNVSDPVGTSGIRRMVSVSVGGWMLTGAHVTLTATSFSPSI